MNRKNNILDTDRLIRYLSEKLHVKSALAQDKCAALQKLTMISDIANLAEGNLDRLLEGAPTIDDYKLRRWFRKGVLAQMYGANEHDMNDGQPYISAANNFCALLQVTGETFILNTDGSIRPTSYPVKLLDATATRWGWISKEKGPDNNKRGLFSLKGYELLPCIFDDIIVSDYEEPVASFAGYRFRFIPDANTLRLAENMVEEETSVLVMPGVRVGKDYAQRHDIKPASPVAASKEDAIRKLRAAMNDFSLT